jgi:hypothetical protein
MAVMIWAALITALPKPIPAPSDPIPIASGSLVDSAGAPLKCE